MIRTLATTSVLLSTLLTVSLGVRSAVAQEATGSEREVMRHVAPENADSLGGGGSGSTGSGDGETTAAASGITGESRRESGDSSDGAEVTAPVATHSPEELALRDRIRNCLAYYYQPEDAAHRSPWGLMHSAVAYGVDTNVLVSGRSINTLGWLCWNGNGRGQRLFYLSGGELRAKTGPGIQGHAGQFLAILAQCRVPSDYGMKVEGQSFTIQDLIEYEQRTCESESELTFKLIGLSHYLDSRASWVSQSGEAWSISRLIAEELAQPVVGAACGGTHRLMGFSYAVRKCALRGDPVDGEWLRARTYIEDFTEYTLKLQNPDGSFSTDWFSGRADSGGIDRRLQTTGHILEWLVFTMPRDDLGDPRIVQTVEYLVNLMLEHRHHGWEIGPKGHALHALALYDERVFGAKPGQRTFEVDEQELPESPAVTVAPEQEGEETDRPAFRRRWLRR